MPTQPYEVDPQHKIIDINDSTYRHAARLLGIRYTGSLSYDPFEGTLFLFNGHERGLTLERIEAELVETAQLGQDEIRRRISDLSK